MTICRKIELSTANAAVLAQSHLQRRSVSECDWAKSRAHVCAFVAVSRSGTDRASPPVTLTAQRACAEAVDLDACERDETQEDRRAAEDDRHEPEAHGFDA